MATATFVVTLDTGFSPETELSIQGVFSTEEKAKRFIEEQKDEEIPLGAGLDGSVPRHRGGDWDIQEHTMDEPED